MRNTHTHMNHDNSRLLYNEPENPGPPLRPQAEHHEAGPVPARGDEASDLAHQQLAVNTAIAASIEWVSRVESNPDAKKAIESAKSWDLKKRDPRLAKELVRCPIHNVIEPGSSDNYETESASAFDHGRTTWGVEQMGDLANTACR